VRPWQETVAAAGLLALFFGLALGSLRQESPTVDEFAHLPAGYYYLKTGDFSLYSKNPPLIKMIAALPWLILKPAYEPSIFQYPTDLRPWRYGTTFMRRNQARYADLFFWGRIPIVILAVLLGLLIGPGRAGYTDRPAHSSACFASACAPTFWLIPAWPPWTWARAFSFAPRSGPACIYSSG